MPVALADIAIPFQANASGSATSFWLFLLALYVAFLLIALWVYQDARIRGMNGIFWLAIVFASFGLFAPANPTAIIALLLCAMAVSGGIALIEDLDNPRSGFIRLPSDPMRRALVEIAR